MDVFIAKEIFTAGIHMLQGDLTAGTPLSLGGISSVL